MFTRMREMRGNMGKDFDFWSRDQARPARGIWFVKKGSFCFLVDNGLASFPTWEAFFFV